VVVYIFGYNEMMSGGMWGMGLLGLLILDLIIVCLDDLLKYLHGE